MNVTERQLVHCGPTRRIAMYYRSTASLFKAKYFTCCLLTFYDKMFILKKVDSIDKLDCISKSTVSPHQANYLLCVAWILDYIDTNTFLFCLCHAIVVDAWFLTIVEQETLFGNDRESAHTVFYMAKEECFLHVWIAFQYMKLRYKP